MDEAAFGAQFAGARRSQKIAFQLDGGEALRALGQAGYAAVAGGGVGQGDHGAGVEIAIGREMMRPDLHFNIGRAARHMSDGHAEKSRQKFFPDLVESLGVERRFARSLGHGASSDLLAIWFMIKPIASDNVKMPFAKAMLAKDQAPLAGSLALASSQSASISARVASPSRFPELSSDCSM